MLDSFRVWSHFGVKDEAPARVVTALKIFLAPVTSTAPPASYRMRARLAGDKPKE
jgi:hypothetical protein